MEIMNGSLRVTTDIKWWSCSFVDGLHEKSMYTNIHRWVATIYISTFYLQSVYVKYRFTSTTISQTYLNTKLKSNQAKHFLINQPNQYTPYLARSLFVWTYHHLIKIITSKYCVCCCIQARCIIYTCFISGNSTSLCQQVVWDQLMRGDEFCS